MISQNKYSVQVKFDGVKDTTAYMSYFFGKGQYYKDTAEVNSKGEVHFSKVDTLEVGMYSVLVGKKKVFDFIVDNQHLQFEMDYNDPIPTLKAKGGSENQIFFRYMKFLNEKQKLAKNLQANLAEQTVNTKEYEKIKSELDELDIEVKAYINQFYIDNKGTLTASFLKAMEPPFVPEAPTLPNGRIDSTFGFRYYKSHFFDNIDLTDERLLRTSVFHEKIMYYLNKLTYQDADSLIPAVEFILSQVQSKEELFKYTLSFLTSKYERSEMMGMDAVFVHLVRNYYLKGKAPWTEESTLKKMKERVDALEPLLIGKKAPNIIVKDTSQTKFLQLYDVKANYTIVYIWSPECGHCKKATPELKKLYDKYKDKGVEVFGVGNEWENEEWIKFINKHDLNWINGSDGGDFKSDFRHKYDVFSTPQTYLLDKDKKILSKKMDVESLEKILEYFFKLDEKKQSN